MISVIVPVLNGMPWLELQLNALADQHCGEAWEVVVADNGSVDGSIEHVRTRTKQHPLFTLVDASAVVGPSGARNAGVCAAKGDRLAFCDADDVVAPGWLDGCVSALATSDVVAGVFDFWSLNRQPVEQPIVAATRGLGFLPAGLGANLAVRRNAFEAVHGFSEDLKVGEDIDLCWRLQLAGFRFAIAPDATVRKRDVEGFGRVFSKSVTFGRSEPRLYRRYRSMGAHRDLRGAIKGWAWLIAASPSLAHHRHRIEWARSAGIRWGRIAGSIREGVFFP
jgi:GT2 family glycosyltransferase